MAALVAIAPYLAAASAVMSVVSLALTLSMKPDGAKDSGASVDRKGNDNPKIVPFGSCRVPVTKVWSNVSNQDTRYLAQAHAIGVGQLKEIRQVFFDAVPYFSSDCRPNEWYGLKSSQEFPNVMAGVRLGRETEEAYSQLFEHSDNEWNAACRGDRTATLSLLVERWINEGGDNDIRIISDRFKVEADVEGVAVVDPRFDTSLSGVSDWKKRTWMNGDKFSYRNPACVVLTYLTDTYYGMSLPIENIDVKSFIDLANYCDSYGYSFDGYVSQDQDFGAVLQDMATSFDGVIYVEDGLVKAKADRVAVPVVDITEEDCVGSFKLSNANESSYYNIVSVEFINADTDYSKDKYVLPKDISKDPTIQSDGFEKTRSIKLPYTIDANEFRTVKKIANRYLKKVRYQKTINFELDNTKKQLQIYDVFTITNSAYKLDKKQFRVDKVETTLDEDTMISKVTATEYVDVVYDSSSYEDGNTSNPTKPPTLQIPSPAGLAFNQTGFTTTGSGKLTWASRYQKEHRTVVEYKLSSASSWVRKGEFKGESVELSNLRADHYDFRVMTQSFMGSTSPWTTITNVEVQGGIMLPTITGLKGVFTSKDAIIQWDDMKGVALDKTPQATDDGINTVGDVFSHYEIQVYKGLNNVYAETLSSANNSFNYSFDFNTQNGLNRDLHFKLFIVGKDGSTSLKAGTLDVSNPQVSQPTQVEVSGDLVGATVKWYSPTDADYEKTNIYVSSNPTFTPSVENLYTTSTTSFALLEGFVGSNYCIIGHHDVFGSDGMAYSEAMLFEEKSIDDYLEDSPNFGGIIGDLESFQGTVEQLRDTITATDGKVEATIDKVDQVVIDTDGKINALTQIKHDVNGKVSGLIMGNDGETSNFSVIADKFTVAHGENEQNVFEIKDNKTYIKNAMIGDLTASNIKAGAITGNSIASNTKIWAGTGASSACLDGQDANWRIYAGHSTGGSAPFRVDKTGKLWATNADITGHIRATSMEFVDSASIPPEIDNSNAVSSAVEQANAEAKRLADAAQSAAEAAAQAKADAAEVAANAHADGKVTAAEAAAIAEAEKLAAAAEARAKAEAEKAKTAASNAHSAANSASTAASNAQGGVNGINDKLYVNQSKVQIKSSNYAAGREGWAIDQNGTAEFRDVKVRGHVEATSGSFSGDLVVKGTLHADVIQGLPSGKSSGQFSGSGYKPGADVVIFQQEATNALGRYNMKGVLAGIPSIQIHGHSASKPELGWTIYVDGKSKYHQPLASNSGIHIAIGRITGTIFDIGSHGGTIKVVVHLRGKNYGADVHYKDRYLYQSIDK